MVTQWKRRLSSGGVYLWSDGTEPESRAVISRCMPGPDTKTRQLYSILSQLDPNEWTPVDEAPADRPDR